MEDDRRIRAIPINDILQSIGFHSSSTILEIGSGTGVFTLLMAQIVKDGHIYACDVDDAVTEELLSKMKSSGIENITISHCREGEISVPKAVDYAIGFMMAHEIFDLRRMLSNLKDTLKAGGKIVLVDWDKGEWEHAPHQSKRVDVKMLQRLMMQEGLFPTVEYIKEAGIYMIQGIKA